MAPPYRNAYLYFQGSCKAEIARLQRRWNPGQTQNTISAIWSDPVTDRRPFEAACANQDTQLPAFQGIIPNRPATKAEVTAAKKRAAAARANANIPQPVNIQPLGHQPPVPQLPVPQPPVPQPNLPQPPYPYDHWPPLPWDPTPPPGGPISLLRPEFGLGEYEHARARWLATKPLMPGNHNEDRWLGQQWLGQGSYGRAGKWVELDDDGNVVDEMVIKDTYCDNRRVWRDPVGWLDRTPREARIHQLVETCRDGQEDLPNLIRYRAHRVWMNEMRMRLYLDFCNYGDLFGQCFTNDNDRVEGWVWKVVAGIPDAFIWHIFKGLVDAVEVLHRGVPDRTQHWRPITHCDITPKNILLHWVNSNQGSNTWPIPVLADFGMTFIPARPDNDPVLRDNPREYKFIESTRYPPEMNEAYGPDTPINDRSDVWLIGSVIWYFLAGRWYDEGPRCGDRDGRYVWEVCNLEDDDETEKLLWAYPPWPSEELCRLVEHCLKPVAANRPSITELKRMVDAHVDAHPIDQSVELPFL